MYERTEREEHKCYSTKKESVCTGAQSKSACQ